MVDAFFHLGISSLFVPRLACRLHAQFKSFGACSEKFCFVFVSYARWCAEEGWRRVRTVVADAPRPLPPGIFSVHQYGVIYPSDCMALSDCFISLLSWHFHYKITGSFLQHTIAECSNGLLAAFFSSFCLSRGTIVVVLFLFWSAHIVFSGSPQQHVGQILTHACSHAPVERYGL